MGPLSSQLPLLFSLFTILDSIYQIIRRYVDLIRALKIIDK
jgi:hypothetical protein